MFGAFLCKETMLPGSEVKTMDLAEVISSGGLTLVAVLSLIQIAPVKINPWSSIARAIGRQLNGEVLDKIDENEAKNARYRILRFDDEIRHEKKHTEEHFNQILDDIDMYDEYCREHPKYPNSKAVLAIENIKRVYAKCKNEDSFL